ncbi:toprim domain-containing protein [Thermovibrio ammonificans]|jgi:5S rRNA maturation endonuclease (ribonuclease M5)|uniref:TOPRIM domain-containing protein n=1 Tax=Thermovibrio ammonificans (strain DSM 15698 / JCM 12110 / HB-1) TaxID=648996 RepID=E8T5X1_THEA1|nr:toprim domain-containing protein [Thermovibrio ammonificans]ADU96555.1 TOPRIM domain-containing protein [Thermovibrio ammonificans HB-1]
MDREELRRLLSDLRSFTAENPDWAVVVEGKRDQHALEILGVDNVYALKGKPFHDAAQELSELFKGAVILTDLDRQGEEIFKKLQKVLPSYGLKVDSSFRERLGVSGVKFVEKIPQEIKRRRDGR